MKQDELYLFIGLFVFALALRIWAKGGMNIHPGNVRGKVIIVTGANTGIGYECVLEFAKGDPKTIILACRSKDRAMEAINKIKD